MSAHPAEQERRYITDDPEEPDPEQTATVAETEQDVITLSLADRVKARRAALETEQTTTLDLPGYEGIIAVEFRLLSWTDGRRAGVANREVDDEALQMLYTSADCLLNAHERFYEVNGDEQTPLDDTWAGLCQRAGVRLGGDATERVAMIALLDDVGVMSLWAEYEFWRVNRGRHVAEAVMRDFTRTE